MSINEKPSVIPGLPSTDHSYAHEVVKQAACQLVGPAATVKIKQPMLLHACAKDSMFT